MTKAKEIKLELIQQKYFIKDLHLIYANLRFIFEIFFS